VFTGDETGVMKAVEAAKATIMAKGYGEAFRSLATARATGAIRTAVAVLEMNMPSSAVIRKRAPRITRGPDSLMSVMRASAAKSTPPVLCNAIENGSMPTMSTIVFQSIER
jgi:hypothetical protein